MKKGPLGSCAKVAERPGSLATFTAMRRASSKVSTLAMWLVQASCGRGGSSSKSFSSLPTKEIALRLCYSADGTLLWGGDDGSDQRTYIRSEGGTDTEAPRNGTQGSGNTQASGDRRQGRSHSSKE